MKLGLPVTISRSPSAPRASSRLALTTAAALAATAAITLTVAGAAGPAGAATSASRRGTEHFQIMSTTEHASKLTVVAAGRFADGGTIAGDITSGQVGRVALRSGAFRIVPHSPIGVSVYKLQTCLVTTTGAGTYRLRDGSGAYTKITGRGKFSFSQTTVLGRLRRKCDPQRTVAYQETITLHGPVSRQ
jgi:hypothetical protein